MTQNDIAPEDALAALKSSQRSALLCTVGDNHEPHSGYAPFIFDDQADTDHHLVIFVSRLARHTRDLLDNPQASIMLIADESASTQIFARTRVSYQCRAEVIELGSNRYDALLDGLQNTHGKMIGLLRTLPDFVLFRLVPEKGQFVMGFGQAFHLQGDKVDQFEHARSA